MGTIQDPSPLILSDKMVHPINAKAHANRQNSCICFIFRNLTTTALVIA